MRDFLLFSLLFLSLFALTFSTYTPLVHAAGQPPIITNTFWEGSYGWGPVDADPGIAYDTASGELISNTYQTLISFNGEQYWNFIPQLATNVPTLLNVAMTITNTSAVAVGGDPTGTTWTNGVTAFTVVYWTDELQDGFHQGDVITLSPGYNTWTVDSLGGALTVTLGLWHGQYVFNIRTNPDIYFYDNNGNHVGRFSVGDVAYSLQRYLVMDVPGQPIWMYDKPLFDLPDHTGFTNDTAMVLANMINAAIVPDIIANTLTINVGCHFPDSAFKQILCGTWGCIGSMNNTIAIGGWNGNLFDTTKYGGPFPDWWVDWAGQGGGINCAVSDPSDRLLPSVYVGTGPYHITTIDSVNLKVILQRNPDFWMGWPAHYCGFVSNSSLDTVEIDYISDWNTRKACFLAGTIDTCAVPRAYMFGLLNTVTRQPSTPVIKTITHIAPTLSCDMNCFQFSISSASTYIGTGSLPGGIPLDFFNNTHCRRAFAYSFNWSTYVQQAFYGEASYRKNWMVPGLVPDYYNASVPGYYESLSSAEAELKAAFVGSQNVWNTGFTLTIAFNTGNDERKIACQMISNFFTTLSTYDSRTGSPFVVNVQEVTWPQTIQGMTDRTLPMFDIGWLADFADADDFARSYMHSFGHFAYYQSYSASNGWGTAKDVLVDEAVLEPDGPARQSLYCQLQQIFYIDCPGFPVAEPRGRFWCQYWVKGWFYNAMYPGAFYYTMWKQDNPWWDITGSTTGLSDGIVQMRDMAYLIVRFNAKAPVPGQPIDPKWFGVYGANGCVDTFGDRIVNMKDIAGGIFNFNAKGGTGHP